VREFRFILGRRALIVFLALLVMTSAILGAPAATQTLAESLPAGSHEVSETSAGPVSADGLLLGPSVYSPLLRGGSSTGTWTRVPTTPLSPSSPSARRDHAMAATPSGVLLFGGSDGYHQYFNDTWLFNTTSGTWGRLTNTITAPSARHSARMATTPSGDVLLFGGMNQSGISSNDTWLFNTTNGTWGLLNTGSASSPSARYFPAMAATPWGVLLFGGSGGGGYPTDTWLFTYDKNTGTGTWTSLNPPNQPSGRQVPAMAATPSGDVLLFGGSVGSGGLDDSWLFSYDGVSKIGAWTETNTPINVNNTPPGRGSHAMAATPWGVLLFGGADSSRYNDTWLFTNDGVSKTGTWTNRSPANSPSARSDHAMAYDSQSGKVILFGGTNLGHNLGDTWLYGPLPTPTISVVNPAASAHWPIGTPQDITWTSTGLDSTTLTILLARDGVHFTETLTCGVDAGSTSWTWTVTSPGTINAKIRVLQDGTVGASSGFFTIATAYYPYTGTLITTSDPVLEISGGSGTGTLWVTPLDPQYTSDPDLGQFIQETGKRSALFFDIGQEGLSGTLTIVLHFNNRLGEETFQLYLWDETKWLEIPGTLNLEDHTFTFTIDAALLLGTPFALGGDPAAMPGLNPWALVLLSLALLGMGGWWFLRRRGVA